VGQPLNSSGLSLLQLSAFQKLREINAPRHEVAVFGSELATLSGVTDKQNSRKVEGVMKIQKAFRTRAMLLAGLGAALLIATPARAQQDMDPTYFDINPGTPRAEHRATARATVNPAVIGEKKMQSQSAADLPAFKDATLEANLVRVTVADFASLAILFGGVILIALYATAATRRERRLQALPDDPYSPTPGATAQ
jgi:hypothetical protein